MKVSRHKEIQGYVLVVCMSLMSGCGTLMSERSGGFSGVREDMKIAKEPFFWIGSLGLLPMMGIASMPVDLAVDIVLYPFDVWLKIVCGSKIHLVPWVIRPRCTALI